MRDAGVEPRPSVLFKMFNLKYRGVSVSFQTVSRWLNARSIPEQDKLQVLAKLVGLEPHALRYGIPSSRVAEPRAAWQANLKALDRESIEAYLTLSASNRKLVRDLIAALRR